MAVLFSMLAVIAIGYVVLFTGKGGGYKVYAILQDADTLANKSQVKIDGVVAGEVTNMTVTPQTTVRVTMKIDKNATPIGSGATLYIRPVDLLGEHYADLDPGNLSDPQPSGTTIPISRTHESVELDDVLNMLDPTTRGALRILLNEAGDALYGRSADFDQLLDVLPSSLDQTQALVNQIGDQTQTVENLIAEGNRDASTFASGDDNMSKLISQVSDTFGVLAAKRQQIGETLADAPGAFGQLTSTLGQLRSAATALSPTADELRSTAPSLTSTLNLLPSVQSAINGTLKEATKVAPSLTALGRQGTQPLGELNPTLARLADFQNVAEPTLNEVSTRGLDDILWFVQDWYLETRQRDAIGHYISVNYVVPLDQVAGELSAFLDDPNSPEYQTRQLYLKKLHEKSPSVLPKLPSLPSTKPSTPAKPQLPQVKVPSSVSSAVQGVTTAVQQTVSTVTKTAQNLTSAVQGVVNGLLHPNTKSTTSTASSTSSASSGSSSNGNAAANLLNYLFGGKS
jgi:virulence factor Mce-like protein